MRVKWLPKVAAIDPPSSALAMLIVRRQRALPGDAEAPALWHGFGFNPVTPSCHRKKSKGCMAYMTIFSMKLIVTHAVGPEPVAIISAIHHQKSSVTPSGASD